MRRRRNAPPARSNDQPELSLAATSKAPTHLLEAVEWIDGRDAGVSKNVWNRLRWLASQVPGACGAVRTVRQVRRNRAEREYRNRFAGDCYGCFWGVFADSDAAVRSAPDTKPLGYDHAHLAAEYRLQLEQVKWEGRPGLLRSYDYPAMFWLSVLLHDESNRTVFDLGGNVGVHFYSYGKRLQFPPSLRWTICDVPSIVEVGVRMAAERGANLAFTTRFEDADGQDVLLASGSIQSVDDFGGMLRSLQRPPKHLLINRLPIYNGRRFVTLQNGGSVFYPQHVFNRDEFVRSLETAGYELVDIWDDLVDACVIPLHVRIAPYHGLFLTRVGSEARDP